MTDLPEDGAPDLEMADLAARFLDGRLDPEQLERLDQRLREEPAAREYCAARLRFASTLRETLNPQRLELLETRRMVIEPGEQGAEWTLEQHRSAHYGLQRPSPGPAAAKSSGARTGWIVGLGLLAGASALWLAWIQFHQAPRSTPAAVSPLVLRNGGFEATDLSLSPRGISDALVDWQDVFPCSKAEIQEIGRVSEGRIFAKSGRNVARLDSEHERNHGYLTQQLRRASGTSLTARKGLGVRVSGWVYAGQTSSRTLDFSLRVIASTPPDIIQYQPCIATYQFKSDGWQFFSVDLKMPNDLIMTPFHVSKTVKNHPSLDLTGHDLYLSIDQCTASNWVLLDDLKIEEIRD